MLHCYITFQDVKHWKSKELNFIQTLRKHGEKLALTAALSVVGIANAQADGTITINGLSYRQNL